MDEYIESCLSINYTEVNPYTNLESPHHDTHFYYIEQLLISLYPLITFKLMDTGNAIRNDVPVVLTSRLPKGVISRCLAIFNQGEPISIDKYRYIMQFEFLPKLQSFIDDRETKFQGLLGKFIHCHGGLGNHEKSFRDVKPTLEDYFNETFDTDPREVIQSHIEPEPWESYLAKKLKYNRPFGIIINKFRKISHDLPFENIQSYLTAIEGKDVVNL